MATEALDLPFEEALAFFRGKIRMPTARWDDFWQHAHARAFMVAGAMRDELLADFQASIAKALQSGTTLEEFRRDFDRIVASHGWSYNGGRNWRTRVIYETNLGTAYQAGRYAQMTDPDVLKRRPYWRYRHGDSRHPRPHHLAWDGTVLRADDPWWKTHFTPNGWGCKCWIESLSERQLKALGKSGPDQAPDDGTYGYRDKQTGQMLEVPNGIDPGWAYNVGGAWLHGVVPPELRQPLPPADTPAPAPAQELPPLPPARPAPASRLLPAGLPDTDYVDAFLTEFGANRDQAAIFRDQAGTVLAVSAELFRDARGGLKVAKRGRERFMLLLADALRDPDEIWIDWTQLRSGTVALRRRYLARVVVPGGDSLVTVFEWTRGGWHGTTAFNAAESYLENQRHGALLYRRT